MSQISNIYAALNALPVDRLAASMFWKTPWWAEVPENVRGPIVRSVFAERLKPETVNVDYFRPPPRHSPNALIDRRGWHLVFPDGTTALVTGYAHALRKKLPRSSASMKTKAPWWVGDGWDQAKAGGNRQITNEHKWWALNDSGGFFIVDAKTTSKRRGPVI